MAAAAVNRGAPRSPTLLRESPAERREDPDRGAVSAGGVAGPTATPSVGVNARFNGGGAPGTELPGAG